MPRNREEIEFELRTAMDSRARTANSCAEYRAMYGGSDLEVVDRERFMDADDKRIRELEQELAQMA